MFDVFLPNYNNTDRQCTFYEEVLKSDMSYELVPIDIDIRAQYIPYTQSTY